MFSVVCYLMGHLKWVWMVKKNNVGMVLLVTLFRIHELGLESILKDAVLMLTSQYGSMTRHALCKKRKKMRKLYVVCIIAVIKNSSTFSTASALLSTHPKFFFPPLVVVIFSELIVLEFLFLLFWKVSI